MTILHKQQTPKAEQQIEDSSNTKTKYKLGEIKANQQKRPTSQYNTIFEFHLF